MASAVGDSVGEWIEHHDLDPARISAQFHVWDVGKEDVNVLTVSERGDAVDVITNNLLQHPELFRQVTAAALPLLVRRPGLEPGTC